MRKSREIWEEEEGLYAEDIIDEQMEADEISIAEAGWILGYSDY